MTEKAKKKTEKILEKDIVRVLIFIGGLVVVFLIATAIFRSMNNFEYEGLSFTKIKAGQIPIYHYSYYFTDNVGKIVQYNLYLRTDPRTADVPIDGLIDLQKNNQVYLSINSSGLSQCTYSPLAVGNFAGFLSGNGFKVVGGSADFWEAGLNRREWTTCENKPNDNVITVNAGNITQINVNGSCYKIEVNNCEILEALEMFQVRAIIDAKRVNS